MTRSRPPAEMVTVAALASIVALLAACSSSGVKAQGAPSSSTAATSSSAGSSSAGLGSSSISPSTSEVGVRASVADAWSNYWRVYDDMSNTYAQAQWPALAAGIAVNPIKGQVLTALNADKIIDVVTYGVPIHHIYWPVVIGDGKVAQLGDCMDSSHYGSMFRKTGQKRTVGPAKINTMASLVKGSDGKWRVSQIAYFTGKPC